MKCQITHTHIPPPPPFPPPRGRQLVNTYTTSTEQHEQHEHHDHTFTSSSINTSTNTSNDGIDTSTDVSVSSNEFGDTTADLLNNINHHNDTLNTSMEMSLHTHQPPSQMRQLAELLLDCDAAAQKQHQLEYQYDRIHIENDDANGNGTYTYDNNNSMDRNINTTTDSDENINIQPNDNYMRPAISQELPKDILTLLNEESQKCRLIMSDHAGNFLHGIGSGSGIGNVVNVVEDKDNDTSNDDKLGIKGQSGSYTINEVETVIDLFPSALAYRDPIFNRLPIHTAVLTAHDNIHININISNINTINPDSTNDCDSASTSNISEELKNKAQAAAMMIPLLAEKGHYYNIEGRGGLMCHVPGMEEVTTTTTTLNSGTGTCSNGVRGEERNVIQCLASMMEMEVEVDVVEEVYVEVEVEVEVEEEEENNDEEHIQNMDDGGNVSESQHENSVSVIMNGKMVTEMIENKEHDNTPTSSCARKIDFTITTSPSTDSTNAATNTTPKKKKKKFKKVMQKKILHKPPRKEQLLLSILQTLQSKRLIIPRDVQDLDLLLLANDHATRSTRSSTSTGTSGGFDRFQFFAALDPDALKTVSCHGVPLLHYNIIHANDNDNDASNIAIESSIKATNSGFELEAVSTSPTSVAQGGGYGSSYRPNMEGFEMVLSAGVHHHPEELGFLFSTFPHSISSGGGATKGNTNTNTNNNTTMGKTACEAAVEQFGMEHAMSCIKRCIPSGCGYPILHHVMEHVPQYEKDFTANYLEEMDVRDVRGRTLLHTKLAFANSKFNHENNTNGIISSNTNNNINTNSNTNSIIHKYHDSWTFESDPIFFQKVVSLEELEERDPVTGLYPFMLAASEHRCDLTAIYTLLNRNSELIDWKEVEEQFMMNMTDMTGEDDEEDDDYTLASIGDDDSCSAVDKSGVDLVCGGLFDGLMG